MLSTTDDFYVHLKPSITLNYYPVSRDSPKYNAYHRLFCILVVWVPSYAHHHLMNVSTSNTGPAIINASGYIGWKIINYLFRKIS